MKLTLCAQVSRMHPAPIHPPWVDNRWIIRELMMEQEGRLFGGDKPARCVVMDAMVDCDEASSFSCRWRNPPPSVPHLRVAVGACFLLLASYGPCSVLCSSRRLLSHLSGPPSCTKASESRFFKTHLLPGMGIVNEAQWLPPPFKCCSIQVGDARESAEGTRESFPRIGCLYPGYFTHN